MREKALHWLYREIKRARNHLGYAEFRHGVTDIELDALRRKIDVLEYLTELVTKEAAEDD